MPRIPALERWRQENQELKIILNYAVSEFKTSLSCVRHIPNLYSC